MPPRENVGEQRAISREIVLVDEIRDRIEGRCNFLASRAAVQRSVQMRMKLALLT